MAIKIYVDADGCPVVDIAIKVAKEFRLEIIVVKNYAHKIEDDYAKIISVDISQDSADLYIVNQLSKGDILISQDYGLAALALGKEAHVLNQDGLRFTKDNIDNMLNRRHIHAKIRRQGKNHSKIKKRKRGMDRIFEDKLRKLISNNL